MSNLRRTSSTGAMPAEQFTGDFECRNCEGTLGLSICIDERNETATLLCECGKSRQTWKLRPISLSEGLHEGIHEKTPRSI